MKKLHFQLGEPGDRICKGRTEYVAEELSRKVVNLELLWDEFKRDICKDMLHTDLRIFAEPPKVQCDLYL